MGHDHSHLEDIQKKGTKRIKIVLWISIVFMLVQLIGGWIANSLALMADAVHMATDVVGYLLALFAFWIARRPATSKMSYGYYRAEIIGALASALFLWILCAFLVYEAIQRIMAPPEVKGATVFFIALVTLVMNIVMMWLLHDSKKESLNVKAAYLHVLSDLLGNIGVILAGGIIWLTGWYIVDPILTLVFTILILFTSARMIKEALDILMEATPKHLSTDEVEKALQDIEGVDEVHDLHIWTVSSGRIALSAHLIGKGPQVLNQAHQILRKTFNILHTTIQMEHPDSFQKECCWDTDASLEKP